MTINFAKNGEPRKDKTLQVYLRYQYKNLTGEHSYKYIPTGEFLKDSDFDLLLDDKLGGKQYLKLQNFLDQTEDRVKEYYKSNGSYPTKEWLMKRADKNKKTIENYIEEFKTEKQPRQKGSTFETFSVMITSLLSYMHSMKASDKKNYLDDISLFTAEETTNRLLKFLVDAKKSNGYIRTMMLLFIRLQNSIRKKLALTEIAFDLTHLKSSYKKYMLKPNELQFILDYKTDNRKYLETQLLIRINMLIGLRIDEILGIEVTDIHYANPNQMERESYLRELNDYAGTDIEEEIGHLTIQILERKKNRVREIAVIDKEIINIIHSRVKQVKTGRLFPDTTKDLINYRIKTIARLTEKFDEILVTSKNIGTEIVTVRKSKWKMISSHSIRKFAVTRNARENGLQVAQYYSGHSDLATIQKHYLDQLDTASVLDILKGKRGRG